MIQGIERVPHNNKSSKEKKSLPENNFEKKCMFRKDGTRTLLTGYSYHNHMHTNHNHMYTKHNHMHTNPSPKVFLPSQSGLVDDLELMFANAETYNEEASQVTDLLSSPHPPQSPSHSHSPSLSTSPCIKTRYYPLLSIASLPPR